MQLPVFDEVHVVERLLAGVTALDWPRDRLQIQVLDDSDDETAPLCARLAAEHRAAGHDVVHLHRDTRAGYKAGALAAGLSSPSSTPTSSRSATSSAAPCPTSPTRGSRSCKVGGCT